MKFVQSALLVALVCGLAQAANAPTDAPQMIEFLKKNVIGKKFSTPLKTFKIGGGKMEADAQVTKTFRNLLVAADGTGFMVEEATDRKQTNFDLDADGKRTGKGIVRDASSVVVYKLSPRFSTGEVTGIRDNPSEFGWESSIRATLKDNTLKLVANCVIYCDLYAPGDNWRPGNSMGTREFKLADDGTISLLTSEEGFDVDPKTLQQTPSDKPIIHEFTLN